jgi:sugar (pentulose or hexulose) kinase
MLAAVASGVQPDLATCAAAVMPRRRTVTPDPAARPAYDGAYESYRRTFDALAPLWRA